MDIITDYPTITPKYAELKGRVAVVTGAARGIGLGITMRLAREGMHVWMVDIDEATLLTSAEALREAGGNVSTFVADLSEIEPINKLFQTVHEQSGGLYLLVNNAAHLGRHRLFDETDDLLDKQLATNIRAPYLCSQIAARLMRDAGQGNIVNISSVGAIRAHWRAFPYDVTKGAINIMTKAMATDLAEYHIRVNAIGPGATLTERITPDKVDDVSARIPMRRFGSVFEMASVVAFLASDDASYVTGQIIYVDGGITVQLSPPGQNL